MSESNNGLGLSEFFQQITKANQQFVEQFVKAVPQQSPDVATNPYANIFSGFWQNASQLSQLQNQLYQQQMQAWQGVIGQTTGEPTKDKRFAAPEWEQFPFFSYVKQSYLSTTKWMMDLVEKSQVDDAQKEKMRFFTKQFLDAMSPSNFALTNPEVLKLAADTKGESLVEGMKNMLEDVQKGYITMTDESKFEVGKNMAVTPGQVIFENELIQLIQYTPTTDQVFDRPLLIVPPCINKYYLMDMQPENSLIRYIVSQGFTTFLVSWKSANEEMKHLTWEDYLNLGVFKAIEVVKAITGKADMNAMGFCIGGTLLTTALAVLRAKGDTSINSATYLTSMIDHSEPGPIKVYLDENMVRLKEMSMTEGGVVKGKELAAVFSSLRANDLIWNYVVNNYLKGKTPPPFDLLYWNSDGTNLPMPMHTYYLRNMYIENNLTKPGKMELCGVKIDVRKIDIPVYLFAAQEDHIVPWKTAYLSTQYLTGPQRFVLGASGHIAGTINPVTTNKRNYWVNDQLPASSDLWLQGAQSNPGSWWPDYSNWLGALSGEKVAAPKTPGNRTYKAIEPAPGRYVKARAE
ncbi:class I poly(R)-hydroxyalkanoic acid synthase [Leeia sp. TBRC 13508]|uniref:Class I poly(R)-hydroxyalkanoic acid synthase n=1 Tax=Leeia speluncae TaxID=2884804 RepID=A0ABS8DAS5_9NEIS|nr:class I poly(R)-hydroxyalkanoic acid synthase [Leeia speluncae]MCB6185324.1 class I poly(R)-hydroxyalkanoic acid synthase [Leeia speluncae]